MKINIIGVCGPSGSGKSTIASDLAERLGAEIIHLDHYFKSELPQICSPDDHEYYPDWNSPESIRSEEIVSRLKQLKKEGNSEWIVVEGLLLFSIRELKELLDIKIYVHANSETCLYRRIIRNISLFGQTPEEIGAYYLKCARHREAVYCLPFSNEADYTIDNDVSYLAQLEHVCDEIQCKEFGG